MGLTDYTTLSRQQGLMREMRMIANNIANQATTGYRQQGVIFSEYVRRTDEAGIVSMSAAQVRDSSFAQGGLTRTGGQLDLAIEGDGFFLVQTPQGERLTRNGAFATSSAGDLVTQDGHPVLDSGGAPVFIPPDATDLAIAQDGTLSSNGAPIGQIGVVSPLDRGAMIREGGVLFRADQGYEPTQAPRVMQGFVESSNADPILQIARMIEVQRAYEMGQNFLQREDERLRGAIKAIIT
ncbi:MAG: flagellar basal-body rod protein FlgF [Rhodobacteraceae bacterium]|jgi:flagellar basal-body rod protein FlgF|uniref:Flagellar basal-body rod protein FlgF n=1 Tax=Salipiger profundus TaxID=1229727 RepID=A0A1U7D3G3_9RHOB|nr:MULTISPECIES: flagellar hook-basal body complex protein [Salipiger]APX22662.1 flagellar basal-body rod protein FlgF [Salipiger profundus]MAB05930.1 flagellar basal-body rod protein FlgF [Paracoccaceae bacterium]GGA10543.1 flagellar basal-body rod protein FlgF [Salipiger profundus]SFC65440.1 flagellar basal-body rod protein FlgF [Salipiger profundus]